MKTILKVLPLAALVAMSCTAAFAVPPPLTNTEPEWMPPPGAKGPVPHGPAGAVLPGLPLGPGPNGAVIADLEQLQMLYRLTGSDAELLSIYRDVLKKSKDPVVRQYTYAAIARAQMRPTNPADAIATIRQSLDEDLTRASKLPPPGSPHGLKPSDD